MPRVHRHGPRAVVYSAGGMAKAHQRKGVGAKLLPRRTAPPVGTSCWYSYHGPRPPTNLDEIRDYSPGFISNEQGRERSLQASMTSASAATVSGASLRLPIASIIFSAMACAFSTIDSVVS